MRHEYDPHVDALTILLLPDAEIARTVEIDDDRHVDLDSWGQVVAIEVLNASYGVQVEDLIERFPLDDFKSYLLDLADMDFRPAIAL